MYKNTPATVTLAIADKNKHDQCVAFSFLPQKTSFKMDKIMKKLDAKH